MARLEDTKVPIGRRYEQIRNLLIKHGCLQMAPMESISKNGTVNTLSFAFVLERDGQRLPFLVDLPIVFKANPTPAQIAGAQRQAWGRFYYWLEANLDLASDGFVDVVDVLMSWIRMQDGRTVGQWVREGVKTGQLALGNGSG